MFRVVTWNVENLFRPAADANQVVQDRYASKLQLLSQVLTGIDADVVALQEIGGDNALSDLQAELAGAYPHRDVGIPDRRGIAVGFLSKHAIDEREDIVDFPPGPALNIHSVNATGDEVPLERMGRGALRIRVSASSQNIHVITAHLKSKLLTFPRPGGSSFTPRDEEERSQAAGIALMRRSAEAVTLRIRISEILEGNAQNPLLLLGDFNDVPAAQTSLILNGPPGSEIGTRGFDRPDQGDDARLFNLGPLIAEARRYSRVHRGRGELLDQIFVSEEMMPRSNSARILPTLVDSLVDFEDTLPSVTENPGEREFEVAPDHAPVLATFEL